MYEVFINEHPIILTNQVGLEDDFSYFLLDTVNLNHVFKKLQDKTLTKAVLYHPNQEELLDRLKTKIPVVVAAGGLVRNTKDELLFIYRNKRWDLPKGKVDKNETISQAAIREVEEETGVKNLVLGDFCKTTYHFYKRNGVYKLKQTYWYYMSTDFTGALQGQLEEGIEKVVWTPLQEVLQIGAVSYPNIKRLCDSYVSSMAM